MSAVPQRGELPTRVVVRAPRWARFAALPVMVVLWAACVATLAGLVAGGSGSRSGDGTPVLASVVGYVLLGLLVLVLPPAAWSVLRFRVVLDADPGRVERRPGGVSLPLTAIRRLRAVPPARVGRANRGLRVEVVDDSGRVAAQVDETMREWGPALEVLRGWAGREPRLVEDEYSRDLLLGADAPR